jgi:hypothetical protein
VLPRDFIVGTIGALHDERSAVQEPALLHILIQTFDQKNQLEVHPRLSNGSR